MKKIIVFLLSFSSAFLLTLPTFSQIDEIRISTYFGYREIECQRFDPGEHLDFMDYLEANEDYPEDEYLGFAYFLNFDGPWQIVGRFTLDSGWDFSGYNLKLRYFPFNSIGLSAGVFRRPHYIRYYDEYLINRDVDYYTDSRNGSDHKYMEAGDKGWMAGLVLPVDYRFLHLTMELHGGLSSIIPFQEEFGQKKMNSNFRRDLVYEAKNSYNWFFFPEATLGIDIFRIKRVRIGIQAQASWYLTKKYLNYSLTTYEWTYDNPITTQVYSPKHRLQKLEFDVGLIVRF